MKLVKESVKIIFCQTLILKYPINFSQFLEEILNKFYLKKYVFNGKVIKICTSFHIPLQIQKEYCCQKFLNLNVNVLDSDSLLSVEIISMQVLVLPRNSSRHPSRNSII